MVGANGCKCGRDLNDLTCLPKHGQCGCLGISATPSGTKRKWHVCMSTPEGVGRWTPNPEQSTFYEDT
jgi:hypothetical protein